MVSMIRAVYATHADSSNPLAVLQFGERPMPMPAPGYTLIQVQAASLNHHDIFALQGIGIQPDQFPVTLGSDGAGTDEDGNDVIIYPFTTGNERADRHVIEPRLQGLTRTVYGTFATWVAVPRENLWPKPPELSFEAAACLCGTWLAAYRMLFTRADAQAGDTVLIQGAAGGLSTALIPLARAAGLRVWVTGRSEAKRRVAAEVGAHEVFPELARLPEPVDIVVDSVGAATWAHSLRSLRHGGTVVVAGATTGGYPPAHLHRIYFEQLNVVGSFSGTPQDLDQMLRLMRLHDLVPRIDAVLQLDEALDGLRRMRAGDVAGKIVIKPS